MKATVQTKFATKHSLREGSRPTISKEDLVSVLRCMLSDKLTETDGGTMTATFEKKFAHTVGKQDSLFVVNDSTAFYLLLTGLGIGTGDSIVVSPLIEPQVWEAIRCVGADIHFVDCAKHSFSMSERALRAKITDKTRAVLISHAFGFSHQNTAKLIKKLKQDFPRLKIIEEGLYALGTTYLSEKRTLHVGTLGDYGVFSLASSRTLTSAKGAVIVAKQSEKLDVLRELRTPILLNGIKSSQKSSKPFLTKTASANSIISKKSPKSSISLTQLNDFSRLDFAPTEIEAALGLSQLQYDKQFTMRRQELVAQFQELIPKRSEVKVLTQLAGSNNARFIALYFPSNKATAYEKFKRVGFDNVLMNFYTLYGYLEQHKLQRHYTMTGLPEVQDLHRRVLLIPIHAGMEENECSAMRAVLKSL